MDVSVVSNFLKSIPDRRLSKEDIKTFLSDENFLNSLIQFQENHFLNTDIIPFVRASSQKIEQRFIYLAPGDSPTKFLDFQRYLNPSLKIIDFPLSNIYPNECPSCQELLVLYLEQILLRNLERLDVKDLPKFCYIDYIMTGISKKCIEKAIGTIYRCRFEFSHTIDLKKLVDLESVRNAENTLTRCVVKYPLNKGLSSLNNHITLHHQIKGHNIFLLLSVFYYEDVDKYRALTAKYPIYSLLVNVSSLNDRRVLKGNVVYIGDDYEIVSLEDITIRGDCENPVINGKMVYSSQILSLVIV
jgi:hypothetical protein